LGNTLKSDNFENKHVQYLETSSSEIKGLQFLM
jgi:hypothetical protein